jgi:hypothetical protein
MSAQHQAWRDENARQQARAAEAARDWQRDAAQAYAQARAMAGEGRKLHAVAMQDAAQTFARFARQSGGVE